MVSPLTSTSTLTPLATISLVKIPNSGCGILHNPLLQKPNFGVLVRKQGTDWNVLCAFTDSSRCQVSAGSQWRRRGVKGGGKRERSSLWLPQQVLLHSSYDENKENTHQQRAEGGIHLSYPHSKAAYFLTRTQQKAGRLPEEL